MSPLLYGSLQDVPVPGKIRRRNSVLSMSFSLYGSFLAGSSCAREDKEEEVSFLFMFFSL
jgi:hypothetical protein